MRTATAFFEGPEFGLSVLLQLASPDLQRQFQKRLDIALTAFASRQRESSRSSGGLAAVHPGGSLGVSSRNPLGGYFGRRCR